MKYYYRISGCDEVHGARDYADALQKANDFNLTIVASLPPIPNMPICIAVAVDENSPLVKHERATNA
jgi:hypothetical protein